MRQLLGKIRYHIQTWPVELILDRRETVLHDSPLRSQSCCIPSVVDVSERKLLLLREIMIDAKELLPPISWRGNRGHVAVFEEGRIGAVAADVRVWKGDGIRL